MKQSSWGAGVLMLVFAGISWGAMYPVTKSALSLIDPFYLLALRYGLSGVLLAIVLAVMESRAAFRSDGGTARILLFGAVGYAAFPLLAFIGLRYTSAEHGSVILALMPLITALINWTINGRRPPRYTLGCVVLALAGVFLVISRGDVGAMLASGNWLGDLLSLLSAVSWVVYTLGASRFPGWSPLRYTTLGLLWGFIPLAAFIAAVTALGWAHPPAPLRICGVAWHLAYLVVPATVLAGITWNAGIRRVGASNGILFINLLPITAFVIGVLLGHRLSAAELVGSALVIGALVLNYLFARQAAARTAAAGRGAASS